MKLRITAIGYLFLLLIIAGCSNEQSSSDNSTAIPVSVTEVALGEIREPITVTGTVYATLDMELASESSGYYRLARNPKTATSYKMGDWVSKNAVIIYLDNPEQENNIKIDSKKLNFETYEREFEKQKSLYDKGGVTLTELKNTEASWINARYDYDNARLLLGQLAVKAPFSGYLVNLPYYTPGTLIASGTTLLGIMNYKNLLMNVNLPDKELNRVKIRQPVLVTNYTLPEDTLAGIVTELAPALDVESRTFKAKITINNPKNVLRPGMFVNAEITIAERSDVIVIPRDIVTTRGGQKIVFVVEKGAAQQRRIETGLENRDELEVMSGLKTGERLVVNGFETLRHRSRVKIVK